MQGEKLGRVLAGPGGLSFGLGVPPERGRIGLFHGGHFRIRQAIEFLVAGAF